MVARRQSSPTESPSEGNTRKRVCKACDRCRLKKSKCDGASPCSRCKSDNAICVFGERKKSHDKIYPKGYVEMLEQQQQQLVSGLQELYRRTQSGEGWTGSPLRESGMGHPLTHDILERLGALKQDADGFSESFEEDVSILQQKLFENGAPPMQRQSSLGSDSDLGQTFSEQTPAHDFLHSNPFEVPPTPPNTSPYSLMSPKQIAQIRPSSQYAPTFDMYSGLNPTNLQRQSWTPGLEDNLAFFKHFESPTTYDLRASMHIRAGSPFLMTDWNDDEDFSRYLDTGLAS
ncbi:MAG: hypothetical protein M1829_002551 [Trizodia sp. TS-e1964]|nr:MAG: hypothetical protein M1829_002551 [Trizodia sp. TS-e1964]